jgi:Viral BACON domain
MKKLLVVALFVCAAWGVEAQQCPTGRSELVNPAKGARFNTGNSITFVWTTVTGATGYDLMVTPDFGRTFIALAENTRNRSHTATLDPGDWGWHVRAHFPGNCPDTHSEPSSFSVAGACDNAAAEPQSPANGATGLSSPVTFTWKGVTGATGYRVLAAIGSTEIIALGTTTQTTLTADVPTGSGFWVVQTFFGQNCPATVSERFALTVTAGARCEDAAPALVSPANNATTTEARVTFKWNAVKNATRYALFVAPAGDDFQLYGTTTGTELESFVPEGTIRWFVVSLFAGCPETRSATFTFNSTRPDTCPRGVIGLRSPANGATVNSPVTLSWNPLTGVESYRVTITDGDASIVRRLTGTELTVELPAGPMRWYIEGLRGDCEPVVSEEGTFTVARAATCDANQPPTLIGPGGAESNPPQTTSPVTFRWNATPNALGYRLWISRGGNAYEDVAVTDKTEMTVPLPAGRYGWFIQAYFRACEPRESGRLFFVIPETTARCSDDAPDPVAPPANATTAAPVRFQWTEVARAVGYRLFVSVDGSAERLIGTTEDTELTRVLPPGAATYRIEAVFANCPSTTSASIPFTVPQAANCGDDAPEPLSPANGATLTEQEVEFAWTPVSNAVRYLLIARSEDGSPVPIGETIETSFTRRMPPGRIEWSVIAFFAGCDPVESARVRFTVTPPQNCTNRSPILLLPADGPRGVHSPVTFAWSRVPGATSYQIWVAQGSPAGAVASTTDNTVEVELPEGPYEWFVMAKFANCPSTESARGRFVVAAPVACGTPEQPNAHVVGQALSGTPYRLRWTPLPNVGLYEVQESTSPDFANAETFVTEEPVLRFVHTVSGAPVQYLYRVRGISKCDDSRGAYSEPVGVFVVAPRTNMASAEVGVEENIVQTIVLPGSPTPLTFVATVDKPWLTVTPSTGTLGADPVTLTVTANPSVLFLGTNTGTVSVTYTSPAGAKISTNANTTTTTSISVSLVTPVTPGGKGTPPPESLIFPVVGHAAGVNDSLFESDIRIANLTPQTMKYQVNFTPSGTDGTQTGSSTTIEVPPNTTTALDDIVASVFGTGTTSSALGMLEVRPLTTASTSSIFSTLTSAFPALSTAASSRTYNFTPNGTFGQFIPAVPFAKFAGKGTVLSLLQVAQSASYRANLGFAEAAGASVDLMVRVYDTKSNLLATIPVSLGPAQHTQSNLLAANGINDLADGRVEVEVVSGNGKVTAYVSEIDNKTNDPLLVNAVPKGAASANRYVVPGMAFIDNGLAFWVSDLRIFNAGTTATPATLTFYPQGNGTPVSKDVTIDAGEIEVLDNVVSAFFGQPNGAGGAIAITTPASTRLSATARTYNQTANGTYGQFIPGVTVAESVGNGDRALQLLQLETSPRFRTNIGVAETSGNPATVEISAIQPDSIVTPVVTLSLAANEFTQLSLAGFFDAGAAVYNARVTVKVIGGSGRVTAYGSAIDVITQDPTYVPAQ